MNLPLSFIANSILDYRFCDHPDPHPAEIDAHVFG